MRHKTTIGVHVCLFDGDCVFLLRRFQTGYGDGAYTIIAGHVEADESATAAAVREVAEEAGVVVQGADLRFIGCMHRQFAGGEAVNLFFSIRNWSGTPVNGEPDKCDQVGWYQFSSLPERMVDYVRTALEQFEKGEQYLEYCWDADVTG